MNADDPFKDEPRRWVGRYVTFDAPTGKGRLSGTVTQHTYAGRTARGAIPDYALTIVGKSGKKLTISMVEQHATFPE